MNNLFEQHQEVFEDQEDEPDRPLRSCPVIPIRIANITVSALLDTGSPINAIQKEFFDENKKSWKFELLPVPKINIFGAFSRNTVAVKEQVYLDLEIEGAGCRGVFMVIPKLNRSVLLGVDFLHEYKTSINLETGFASFCINDAIITVDTQKYSPSLNLVSVRSAPELPIEHMMDEDDDDDWKTVCSSEDEEFIFNEDDLEVNIGNDMDYSINEFFGFYPETDPQYLDHITKVDEEAFMNKVEEVESMGNLSKEEKFKLTSLLHKYRGIFSKVPGKIKGYEHEIEVEGVPYFRKPPYRLKAEVFGKARRIIEDWLRQGIIVRSQSGFISPIVFIKKKNGELRPCLDARFINSHTKPMPDHPSRMEDLLRSNNNIRFISTMDLSCSFLQVPLHKNSRKYAAFEFGGKCYEFTRVAFGLRNSLPALIRSLEDLIPDEYQQHIKHYVDDYAVFSESFAGHLEYLEVLFGRCQQMGVKLNISKCNFLRTELPILGFMLTQGGIEMDPKRTQALVNFPRPRNQKDLKSFLGFTNFYARFSPHYSVLAKPLYELLHQDRRWEWCEEHERGFQDIKTELSKAVCLHHPDYGRELFMETDASRIGVSGYLYQLDEKSRHIPLGFVSRVLTLAESSRYSVCEIELLAITFSLEKFFYIIDGHHVTIRTDHKALEIINRGKMFTPRVWNWIIQLQNYDIDYQYIPGRENFIADYLSRNMKHDRNQIEIHVNLITNKLERLSRQIPALQRDDCELKMIIENIEHFHKYELVDDVLLQKKGNKRLIMVPDVVVYELIQEVHIRFSHTGIRKTYHLIRERFNCVNLYKKVTSQVRKCHLCQICKPSKAPKTMPDYLRYSDRLHTISIDHLGPYPVSTQRKQFILTCVCNFTRFVKLFSIRKANALETINCIKIFIQEIGKPKNIICDNASSFRSEFWRNELRNLGITLRLTSIKRPQSNLAERVNAEIVKMLRLKVYKKQKDWAFHIRTIEDVINCTYNHSIGMTPYQAMYNEPPVRLWDDIFPNYDCIDEPNNDISQQIRARLDIRKEKIVSCESGFRNEGFKVNDNVLVKSNVQSKKLRSRCKKLCQLYDGPYVVKEIKGCNTYVIGENNGNDNIKGIYHANRLKRYYI